MNVGADHQDLFQSLDLNGNGFLDFQEFRRCLNYDGELEQWAATLPLAPLLACCIPIDGRRQGSHIRELCELKDADIEMAMRAFADGARRVVAARLAELRAGFEELGRRAAAQTSGTSAKFETCEMACGSIDDFHRGIQERIGDRILCVSMRSYGTELADPELAVHGQSWRLFFPRFIPLTSFSSFLRWPPPLLH